MNVFVLTFKLNFLSVHNIPSHFPSVDFDSFLFSLWPIFPGLESFVLSERAEEMMCEGGWCLGWRNGFPLNNAIVKLGNMTTERFPTEEKQLWTASTTVLLHSSHVKCQLNQSWSWEKSLAAVPFLSFFLFFFGGWINKTWQRWFGCFLLLLLSMFLSWAFVSLKSQLKPACTTHLKLVNWGFVKCD